jgi:hypothetical protein
MWIQKEISGTAEIFPMIQKKITVSPFTYLREKIS